MLELTQSVQSRLNMIRRLQRVKAFGSFHDFSWPTTLHDFKKFNLVFGWNYSGKTTFTRTLRCFELNQYHPDFGAAEVQFCVEGGTDHHLTAFAGPHLFRVFNSDYVRESIRFESGSADAILMLGVEDIAKQDELAQKNTELGTLNHDLATNVGTRKNRRDTLDGLLTSKARDIKNDLNRPNYDRSKFEPRVEDRKTDFADFILTGEELQRNINAYRSTDKKDSLSLIALDSLTLMAGLQSTTAALLSRTVTANTPIARLSADASVERWVNQGRPLHEGKSDCQFCGLPLPAGLMVSLEAHFSADYSDLMTALENQFTTLGDAAKETIQLHAKSAFYAEQGSKFDDPKGRLEFLLHARKSAIEDLRRAIADKQLKAFSAVSCPDVIDNASDIKTVLEEINTLVTDHNTRTSQFEINRSAAFGKLETHYASIFVQDNRYSEALEEISNLDTTIGDQREHLGPLRQAISDLEGELSDAVKGAETINEFMLSYFAKADLKIVVVDNRFQITRNSVPAKNLSEGERTSIAFAYFMTKVLDGKHALADTTVIIDDPIASLDGNHLFNTYSFIKTKLSMCFQLFILTHNFEFYSLMREWALDDEKRRKKKPQTQWHNWSIYLIRRNDDGHSLLEEIPSALLKFHSEYHYLFATLLKFEQSTDPEFDYLMSLPNIARRFMEAFGGVMIPTYQGLRGKLPRLFDDPVEAERVWKFVNNFSHNDTLTRSLVIPDLGECKAVVTACLNSVKCWDKDYFKDLEESLLADI